MNKQDFNQLGGFPLETNNLDWMQSAYDIFNALGYIAGNKTIISGCVVTGANVSDGVVFLDGEIYKFVGGVAQATVRVLETPTFKVFENGDNNVVHRTRYITFASGAGAVNWADFKRITEVVNLNDRLTVAETKLATIEEGAEVNVQADFNVTDSSLDSFIKNKQIFSLLKGTYSIGDVDGTDVEKTIAFSNVGTSNYMVVGSLVSLSGSFNTDNDVIWSVKSKTSTSFKLLLREVSGNLQNIQFNYQLIPL